MKQEKRMISDTGYEVKHSIHIGDCEVVVAENMKAPDGNFYFIADYIDHGLLAEYTRCNASHDYLEIMQEFVNRLEGQIEAVRQRIGNESFDAKPITAEECYPNDYNQSIDGKVVAIKAEVLRPEYRRGDRQLVLVDGGNGASANSRGNAVFCYHLNNGTHTRFERYDVLGEIKVLPEWAKEKFARLQAEKGKRNTEKRFVGNYEITESIEVGSKVFVMGYNPKAAQP